MGIPFRFREPDYLPLAKVKRDPGSVGLPRTAHDS